METWFNKYQRLERWGDENIWNSGHENEKECPLQAKDWAAAEKRRKEVTEYRLCEILLKGGIILIIAGVLKSYTLTQRVPSKHKKNKVGAGM